MSHLALNYTPDGHICVADYGDGELATLSLALQHQLQDAAKDVDAAQTGSPVVETLIPLASTTELDT